MQGRLLQRKVLATFSFVFLSLLLRSVFAVMESVATAKNDTSNQCALSQCDDCKNTFTHMLFWMIYTPVFQNLILLIASPLSLLVALWGMSGVRPLEQMRTTEVATAAEELKKLAATQVRSDRESGKHV